MRRLIDVVISGLGLVVATPILAAAAIAVRVSSPGPILFRQERVGRHGETFEIFKFRSMVVAAPSAGPAVTSAVDSRITRVGATLRSTKLDELPQLLNVLRGDMSLVGPRPEVAQYAKHWTPDQRRTILSVRPGITDPASLKFRREAELLAEQADPEQFYIEQILPEKAEMYVTYIQNRTLAADLRLLAQTARSVVMH